MTVVADGVGPGGHPERVAHPAGGAARILFVPVSGPRGMGEYARSVAIATALTARWPAIRCHFVLSSAAPYARDTPFPHTLLPSSPTFHSDAVRRLIREFRPALVLFDNAGRTAQVRAAAAQGAKVVYVSSRPRQRRKAFRVGLMRLLDEHWIAYPQFIAGDLSLLERLKLRLCGGPRIRFLDTLLPMADPTLALAVMSRFEVLADRYVLLVPGGGSAHPGALDAPAVFAAAARSIAHAGLTALLVGAAPAPDADLPQQRLRLLPRLPMNELCELIRGARLVVANGGDTLFQVLACDRPCVAVPIAGDQPHRIARCVARGLVTGAALDVAAIVRAVTAMLERDQARDRQSRSGPGAPTTIVDAMGTVLGAIGGLVEGAHDDLRH